MNVRKLVVVCCVLLTCSAASATIVVNETFEHSDGALVGQTPTPGPGDQWAAHSGAGNRPVMVTSGQITLAQASGSGEDVNSGFAAMGPADTLYAGFDVMLPSGQTVNPDASGLYFAHFRTGTTFRGRVFIVTPSAGGDFGIALDGDGSSPSVTWPSDLTFDTTYRIIVSYDYDTGNCQLWIDAADISDPSITDSAGTSGTAVSSFAFRQSDDYTGTQVIDNLIVADEFSESVPVELMAFTVE
jgi:hypothetical protein